MISVQALTTEEQDYYDSNSKDVLDEKIIWLDSQLKSMVDAGKVTAGEKQQLLAQLSTKYDELDSELKVSVDKPKKAEKLASQMEMIAQRRETVRGIEPIRHPLKHEDAILGLRAAIIPIIKLEGMPGLRTMAEMTRIGTKPDMEAEVLRLESESRCWFEEDAEFLTRCAFIEAAAAKQAEKQAAAAAKKASSSKNSTDGWETVSSMGTGKSSSKSGGRR